MAAWYYRLASAVAKRPIKGSIPLASVFLKRWLDNRAPGALFYFSAPGYLKRNALVVDQLKYHRSVFLSEEAARTPMGLAVGGVVPRIKGTRVPKLSVPGHCALNYNSLVEIGSGYFGPKRVMGSGTPEEKDLFTSLRGFQLRSDVVLRSSHTATHGSIRIDFRKWTCYVIDKYDFAANEYLTVQNPDFGSNASGAVSPEASKIEVHHNHAIRVERAGLAAVFRVASKPWDVIDPEIIRDGLVDAS